MLQVVQDRGSLNARNVFCELGHVHLLYFCMVAHSTLTWNIKCYNNRCWCSENCCVVREVPLPDLVGAWCAVSPCKIIGLMFFGEI